MEDWYQGGGRACRWGRGSWQLERRVACEMRMEMRGWLTLRTRNEAWVTFNGGEGLDEDRKERRHTVEDGEGEICKWGRRYKCEF